MVPVQQVENPVRHMRAVETLQRLRNENKRLRELIACDPKRFASVYCPEDSVLVNLAFMGAPLTAKSGSPLYTEVAPES